jgi:hypothetical protein
MKGLLAMNSQVSGQVGALRPGGGGGGDGNGAGGNGDLFDLFLELFLEVLELIFVPRVLCSNPLASEVTTKKLKKDKTRKVIILEVFMVDFCFTEANERQGNLQDGTVQSKA